MNPFRFLFVAAIGLVVMVSVPAWAGDAFMGDWQGRWLDKSRMAKPNPQIVAQVVPRGGGAYRVNLLAEFDQRAWPYAQVTAHEKGGKLVFDQDGWSGAFENGVLKGASTDEYAPGQFEMKRVTRLSPRLGAKPPKGAIVLFDGTNFDAWEAYGKPGVAIPWEILPSGAMRVVTSEDKAKRVNLATRQDFGDVRLHVEFRNPLEPENVFQYRSNSGVFLQDVFELQILDSYGVDASYTDCGALYKVAAPRINACAPPLQWQSFDITFRTARFNDTGEMVSPPTFTVNHNGHLIHRNEELPHVTSNTQRGRSAPIPSAPGKIWLQDHGHEMEFRNIWVLPLDDKD
ncbi:MAG: 3-keto-disaccharide hydrolase [Planctomycetota bacterium]|jgi:hypothetical protein